ncbi:hypothetical protein [Streptomyces sp. NPDC059122]|uniref:hypothetical protein n=1 Tax=unclassified Streptomyces TaxID=2593676 RepID=UPI003679A5B6
MVKDDTDGSVVITTPDDGHTIEPGAPLTVNIQVLYPSQHVAGGRTLRSLRSIEMAQP